MALQYLFDPNKQFQSTGGVNEVGGFLRVFFNGTDDRATTYRNFDGGLNEPDIVLDTYGRAVVIVDDTKTYRIEVYNRLGGLMWTVSNYKATGGSGGGSGTPVSVEGTVGEIDVDENTEGGVKHFVIGLASTIKNAIATLTMAVNGVANALNGKKDKQTPVNESSATTKTLVGISQDEDGVMTPEFDDIAFPDYSQRFEDIENEQIVDAKVIAAALNDLNVRMESVEDAQDEKNIGERIADAFDSQNLFERGVRVKVRQAAKSLDGATNKTVTNVSQDENGEITVTFSSISLSDYEKTANKKTSVTGNEGSNTYYPTIKALVDYLDSRLQNLGGKKITNNGVPFTTASQLPTTTPYYGQNINTDDYAYVQDTGLASRYTATVTGSSVAWSLDYEIALPVFTTEQQASIDSGANSTKIGNYDSHLENTDNPHGVTYSQVGASPDTHTHQVVINGVTKTIDKTGGTPVDLGTYLTSHQDLSNYLTKMGNGSDVTASFTAADSRNNISTGEKLSVIFGKIAKWFSDLKALAFKDKVSDSDISGTIADAHIASASAWNAKQNALPITGTPSSTFAINVSGTARYSENLLPYCVSTDNDKSWLEVGTYKSNNTDEMYTGITFAVKFRSVDGHTQSGFVWISVGEWKSGGDYSNADIVCEYYTLGRRVKERFESVKLYVNILGTSVTDGVKIYAYLSGYSNISLTPLNVNKGTYTSSMTYLNAEPTTKKEMTYCNLLRSTYGTAIGDATSPIYVDGNGVIQECSSLPIPTTESWSGEASTTATGISNSGMIRFRASLNLVHGWGDDAHGFINYEVNCTSSSRKGDSVCAVRIDPGYSGGAIGTAFLSYPFKFVENPESYTDGTGVHICGVGNCWVGSLRTIPSSLIIQVDADASKFNVGDTLGISVRVSATKLL